MLKDAAKERIRLEELFRREVREQLSAPSSNRIWTFLNSTFGVWLLSALFITGMGAAITKYQETRSAARLNQEAVERLDLEIGYRFSQVQVRLYAASLLPDAEREGPVRTAVEGLSAPPSGTYQHLFPEYQDFSIPALVAELRRRENSTAKRDELSRTLAHLTGMQVFLEVRKAPMSDPTRVAGAIISDLVLGRWKDSDWYFLDGSKEQPFP